MRQRGARSSGASSQPMPDVLQLLKCKESTYIEQQKAQPNEHEHSVDTCLGGINGIAEVCDDRIPPYQPMSSPTRMYRVRSAERQRLVVRMLYLTIQDSGCCL